MWRVRWLQGDMDYGVGHRAFCAGTGSGSLLTHICGASLMCWEHVIETFVNGFPMGIAFFFFLMEHLEQGTLNFSDHMALAIEGAVCELWSTGRKQNLLLPLNTQRIANGPPLNSQRIPNHPPVNSQRIPNHPPVNSQRIPNCLPLNSQMILIAFHLIHR